MNAPEVPLATRARSVGVEHRGASRAPVLALHPCLPQHPLDGVVVDAELGGDGAHRPMFDEVVAQDLRLELVVDRHRARRSVPGATTSASSYRRAAPLQTDKLADRTYAEVAVLRDSRFGGHGRTRLAYRNSMTGECTTASGRCGTVMRHFFPTRRFTAPAPVAPLALGMTVPAAPGLLIATPCRAQRFASVEAAAVRSAVLLSAIAARTDEYLTFAPRTQKQSRIVHRPPPAGRAGRSAITG